MTHERWQQITGMFQRQFAAVVHFQPAPGIVIEERLVIVDDGREVRSATVLPLPVMATGVGRRVHRD